ncbi:Hsp20/alpha crystallin family protein [Bacillus sp. B1-b2]|nr:Hsp20/alpha crystallin family protein [Bacillus sp. B1-b2]
MYMSFEDLQKIYQFVDHSHKDEYWQQMFTNSESTKSSWHHKGNPAIKNSDEFPACDYYLKDNMYYIDIELPSQKPVDVTLTINKHILSIEGSYQTLLNGCTYFIKERQNKSFQKLISIPEYIGEQHIKKQWKDGLLRISFLAK